MVKTPELTVNVVEVKVAGTVTEAGTISTEAAVLVRETGVPPEGAALEMVTVQVVLVFGAKTLAVHWKEDSVGGPSVGGATSEIARVAKLPFTEAVRVAV